MDNVLKGIQKYSKDYPHSTTAMFLDSFSIEDDKIVFNHTFYSMDEDYINDYVSDIVSEICFELTDVIEKYNLKRSWVESEHDYLRFDFSKMLPFVES